MRTNHSAAPTNQTNTAGLISPAPSAPPSPKYPDIQKYVIPGPPHLPPVEWVWMTPELAMEWLERNTDNRKLRQGYVDRLMRAMQSGQWKVNGDTIRFTKSGIMFDGQHRLWACFNSGVPFWALVVREIDDDAINTVDINQVKKLSDFWRGIKNATQLAACMRIVAAWENNDLEHHASGGRYTQPTNEEANRMRDQYPALQESVAFICGHKKLRRMTVPSLLCFLHFATTRKHPKEAAWFFDRLETGVNLQANDALLHLKNQFERERENRGRQRMDDELRMALAIKAWNCSLNRKPCQILRYGKEEDFPVIQ